jgi:hypothetical protein
MVIPPPLSALLIVIALFNFKAFNVLISFGFRLLRVLWVDKECMNSSLTDLQKMEIWGLEYGGFHVEVPTRSLEGGRAEGALVGCNTLF